MRESSGRTGTNPISQFDGGCLETAAIVSKPAVTSYQGNDEKERNRIEFLTHRTFAVSSHHTHHSTRIVQLALSSAKLASSLLSEASKLYAASTEALFKSIPPTLQDHLSRLCATADHYLPQAVADNLPTSSILLCSLLLPVIILFSMSSWSQRPWPTSGRYSPFTAHGGPPRVSDADYSYIGDDDIAGSSPHNSSYALHGHHHHAPRADSVNPLAPDILLLRHKGTSYPLHFSPFSIAEGDLSVADLRRCAARETGCNDERRIHLLYKRKELKDDRRACREEGLKQNSEIVCVISASSDPFDESGHRFNDEFSTSGSGDDDDPYGGAIRADIDGTPIGGSERRRRKGHRSGRRRKGRSSQNTSPRGSGYLHPEPSHAHPHSRESSPMPHEPSSGRRPEPVHPQPSATPISRPTSAPDSAEGKLEAIARTFHTSFVPQCVQYMSNPPSLKKDRDFEYKKLSEGILAQVILKLDEVQTEDAAVKARRKELVKETQQILNRLDEVVKMA